MSDDSVNYYYYLNLIKDQQRIKAFQAAIQETVKPGDVVVELGSGLGTYSFFAARAGARSVYAIEKAGIIRAARQLARLNNLVNRVQFVEGDSTEVSLPERGDLLILENFSSLFIRRRLMEILHDALNRHLKEGGRVIPQKASMFVAPFSEQSVWKECLRLEDTGWELYQLKLGLLRQMMLNSPHVVRAGPGSMLSQPKLFTQIEVSSPGEFLFDVILTFRIERPGMLHGLLGWFDLQIAQGICLTNAPWNSDSTWGQVAFPLNEPRRVEEGEEITARLSCQRGTERDDLWYAWQCATRSGVSESSSLQGLPFHVTEFE